MASTYTPLGIEKMATGENAGTWGTKTNTNLEIIEQISGGYITQAIAGTGTTAFTESDGSTDALVATRVIVFTGALTGTRIITFPVGVANFYLIKNGTTEDYSLQLKAASGSGATVTWAAGDRNSWKIIYFDGVATDTGVYDVGSGLSLTSPNLVTGVNDVKGNELLKVTATASAVNEFTLANAATGNGPILSATGETNVDINLNPKGSGTLKSGTAAVKVAGKETIFVPAQAMFGTTTNGADAQAIETTATRPEMKVLDFDASTIEYAQFSIAMPKSWDLQEITFQAFWSPSNTNTGAALIGLQAISVANDATSDIAFPTAVDVTDSGTAALEDVLVSPVSGNVTVTSAADDTYTYFQVARNATAGGDTFTGDVRLLGIKLFYTTDAANDA